MPSTNRGRVCQWDIELNSETPTLCGNDAIVKVLSGGVRNEIVTAGDVVQRRRRASSLFIGRSESTDEIVVLVPGFDVKDSQGSVHRD